MILALMASFQAVGSILSIGLLVIPGAIVSLFTNDTKWLFIGGGIVGSLSAVFAVILSVPLDIPTGPTIVMVLGSLFLVSCLIKHNYKVFSKKT